MAMRDTGHNVRQCAMSLAEVEQIAEELVAEGLAERRVNANGEVEYRTLRRRGADGIHRQEEKGRGRAAGGCARRPSPARRADEAARGTDQHGTRGQGSGRIRKIFRILPDVAGRRCG